MGRRRKFNRITLTTINISVETADIISKLKNRRETQDDFVRRVLEDWKDFQEYKLDMDLVLKLKDKKISSLETELENYKNPVLTI
jgi:molybdenum cofactor biosynthesis enzyme MoaA